MSSTLLPERFTSGDFTSWLRHFEHCASANGWEYDVKLVKLPAFLQGPAAPYSDSFLDEEKSSLRLLTESLSRCFSPAVDREQFYRQFEEQTLWPGEDRSLFLWWLRDILQRARPDLSNTATDVLLRNQCVKGLPQSIRLRLLGLFYMSSCAVPCRAVPCRAVPCRAVPCRAVPCRAVPCRAVPSNFWLVRHSATI